MNETWRWDDVRLFLAVARSGGLAGAVPLTGLSAPTLGRRVLALEQALTVPLFERRRDGYDLTAAGRDFMATAEGLEREAFAIERWRSALSPQASVRIAAGAWTSAFLAGQVAALRDGPDDPGIEILTGAGAADLVRREAQLGIRNRRPERLGLAGRRLQRVAFAVYAAPSVLRAQAEARDERRFMACDWIAFGTPDAAVPSARWLERRLERPVVLRCSAPQPVLDAAVAGVGLCVLPCFVGDRVAALRRASSTIDELAHEQWLVSHDEDRHNRSIRSVMTLLVRLFRAHKALFAGEEPHDDDALAR